MGGYGNEADRKHRELAIVYVAEEKMNIEKPFCSKIHQYKTFSLNLPTS
jgi:hypothetical protein